MYVSSNTMRASLADRLRNTHPDQMVFVGVGNRGRGDDAIGPLLLDGLSGYAPHLIDAGVTPEEYTGVIKRMKPEIIIFFDGVDFGADPGMMNLVEIDELSGFHTNTHKLSLDILMDYLKQETGADVFLIGLQYARLSYTSGLSEGMDTSIQECVDIIRSVLSGHYCMVSEGSSLP